MNLNLTTTSGGRPQNEPSIAIDPVRPEIWVATANDYQAEDVRIGLHRSTDGGTSFISALMPVPPGFGAAGGAVAVSGPGNLFLVVGLSFNRPLQDGTVVVYRSLDAGETFSDPILVASGSGTEIFHDKPCLAVDCSQASPYVGRAYVSYNQLTGKFRRSKILFQRSEDAGETWSLPVRLSPRGTTVQGSTMTTGPDGKVYVGWMHLGPGRPRFLMRRSDDGGATFGPVVTVTTVRLVPTQLPVSGWAFRTPTFAVLRADTSPGRYRGRIYAVWQQNRFGASDIVLSSSGDRGRTWSYPVKVNDGPGEAQDFFPSVSVSPETGTVKVAYYTNLLSRHRLDVFMSESGTGGASFTASRRLTTSSFDPNADPFFGTPSTFIGDCISTAVLPEDRTIAIWTDTRTGSQNIFAGK